jgi:hypothetical protein
MSSIYPNDAYYNCLTDLHESTIMLIKLSTPQEGKLKFINHSTIASSTTTSASSYGAHFSLFLK